MTQFDTLWEGLTAKEHLELFAIVRNVASRVVVDEAKRRLEEIRLNDVANQRCGVYSGGMKRRLSISMALIGSPEVVSKLCLTK